MPATVFPACSAANWDSKICKMHNAIATWMFVSCALRPSQTDKFCEPALVSFVPRSLGLVPLGVFVDDKDALPPSSCQLRARRLQRCNRKLLLALHLEASSLRPASAEPKIEPSILPLVAEHS